MNNALPDEKLIFKRSALTPETLAKMVGVSTLSLQEVWDDVTKVASTVATMYTDQSCYALSYDDLHAECLKKFVDCINKGYLKKPRAEFFKLVKTAMNNHARGIVQRHRFTIKRTGHRPPDRDDVNASNFKPDVSLDDPDIGLQVENREADCTFDIDRELVDDVKVYLTPLEQTVLDQLVNPNEGSYMHAYMEASVGRRRRDGLTVRLSQASMAYGLGMDPMEFSRVQESIKRKFMTNVMTDKSEDTKFNVALATLEETYGVQVPRSTERVVVARLFTICARDQLDKFTPEVEKHLAAVGAKPPVIEEGRLSCYGVLFQKNHRVCQACGLKESCRAEAANHGLGEITLSPKLLGSRNVRYATLTDSPQPPSMSNESEGQAPSNPPEQGGDKTDAAQREPFTNTERDEVLLQHLREHYKPIKFGTDIYYTHKDGKNACVFHAGKEGEKFELRFCKPSEDLKKVLVRKVRSFYLPDDMTSEQAVKLMEQHGNAAYKQE